jgi:hypothetical protein
MTSASTVSVFDVSAASAREAGMKQATLYLIVACIIGLGAIAVWLAFEAVTAIHSGGFATVD